MSKPRKPNIIQRVQWDGVGVFAPWTRMAGGEAIVTPYIDQAETQVVLARPGKNGWWSEATFGTLLEQPVVIRTGYGDLPVYVNAKEPGRSWLYCEMLGAFWDVLEIEYGRRVAADLELARWGVVL